MKDKPAWRVRDQAKTKSLINWHKEKYAPKPCTECGKEFKPINKFSRYCSKCKATRRRIV